MDSRTTSSGCTKIECGPLRSEQGTSVRTGRPHRLSLKFQMFNVFNRHGLGGPNTTIGGTVADPWDLTGQTQLPAFGKVTWQNVYGAPGPRVGQFGARFTS